MLCFFLTIIRGLCYNMDTMNTRDTLKVVGHHLEIGGKDCVALAEEFGTPLYVMDEAYIRRMMRVYRDAINNEYGGNGLVLYASKAFSCKAIYSIANQEQIGADVVSGGELYTALQAGFPAERITLHGNNKLTSELELALKSGVGTIVVDSLTEAERISALAREYRVTPRVLLRINPGVEAHTHAYVQTATPDSKFGFSVADGSAEATLRALLRNPALHVAGFHCHIGSQIFEKQSFVLAAQKCISFMAKVKETLGFETEVLNLGGGFGIWYAEGDRMISPAGYRDYLLALIEAVKEGCKAHALKLPFLNIEPGRSIVGEAGITLYRVGAIKDIKGIRKYLAIDGGMFDNPRYALYQSKYTAVLANRADEQPSERVALAGKCCESGDLIGLDFDLPKAEVGDLVAVLSTGAYNYSMASNYNRNLIPPVVLVKEGKAEYIVKPQSYEDVARNDVLPAHLK